MIETSDVTDNAENAIRPSLSFENITFSDGQTLQFDDDEIVVLVGPNNAGKSACLRELQNWVARSYPQDIVKNATLRKVGDATTLKAFLEKNAQKSKDVLNVSYAGINYNIAENNIFYFDQANDRHPVASFFCTRLATETRITASDPAGAIALHESPPSHPIHLLLKDPRLADKISEYFYRAFGKDLVVFRAGGSSFPLYVGKKPEKMLGEDALDKSYVERLQASAVTLSSQGDGMRSFASVLLYTLLDDSHSIQFLDEPEAFLHPPQAKLLGEYIATQRRTKSQLFIATHSTAVLDGIMAGNLGKVRILRIQREGNINHVKELSKEKTRAIINDTLTRYTNVFQGIFYEHVIITESDSDCLLYNSILDLKSVSGDKQPDVLFIHASGKHRLKKLAETLKSLDVPISVIVDLDVLNDEVIFRGIFEKLGGTWNDVVSHWKAIKTSVEGLRPPLGAEQVKSLILQQLEGVGGTEGFPKQIEQQIKRIFSTQSPWDTIKQAGRSGLRGAQAIQHFDDVVEKCAEVGLWLVPVGEAEGFCRSVEGHGPAFVEKLLELHDLEHNRELEEVRTFMKKIWDKARNHKRK